MARPTRLVLASGIAAWDADVDANFGMIFDAPFPMHQEDTIGDLNTNFPASSYDQCLAMVGEDLYVSDGTSWSMYLGVSANVPDSTASNVAEMVSDFNDLLNELQTAGIMATS